MADIIQFEPTLVEGNPEAENLKIERENGIKKIHYASVYGNPSQKVPPRFFTSQPVYREFCVEVAGRKPNKRATHEFEKFMDEALANATVRETLPGMEDTAIVAHAVLLAISRYINNMCDYDVPAEERKTGQSRVNIGDPGFLETRPEVGRKEIFIRINNLMEEMTKLQGNWWFERKITREEVCDWLVSVGRGPYERGNEVSPRRLRSTYPIPIDLYWEWDKDRRDVEGGK